ncbi:hypothetical protein ACFE04_021536 [Oxalis oulophora]
MAEGNLWRRSFQTVILEVERIDADDSACTYDKKLQRCIPKKIEKSIFKPPQTKPPLLQTPPYLLLTVLAQNGKSRFFFFNLVQLPISIARHRKRMSNADNAHNRRAPTTPVFYTAFSPSHHQPLQLRFPSCAPPGGREDGVGNSIKMMNNARLVIYSHVSMNSSSSAYYSLYQLLVSVKRFLFIGGGGEGTGGERGAVRVEYLTKRRFSLCEEPTTDKRYSF